MALDIGDVAGVLAGYKAGTITYDAGVTAIGVGVAVGGLVDDLFDGIFGGD